MISVKGGTQTWSKAPQQSGLEVDRSQHLSADEREKFLGSEPIGDILNKVADPNWVDPSKTRRVGNSDLDKDAFLKLLLTQMKHQDPTNPMQSHEMSAQLAQFSSLEKLENIDSGIEKLASGNKPQTQFEALNLIGKGVSGDSSKIIRTDEKEKHNIAFDLASDASNVKIKIRSPQGEIVREQTLSNLKQGKNEFEWNGVDNDGREKPVGEYQVFIEATDSVGKKVHAQTAFEGVITGVNFGKDGPVLMIGNQSVRLTDVKKIVDPALLNSTQSNKMLPIADPVKAAGPTIKASNAPVVPTESGLQNVAMSQDFINRLEKETKE